MKAQTVLIVDDDPDTREVLAHLLHLHGYLTIPAADGREALDQIEGAANLPSLVLLDLDMPDMNGTEFLERLREHPEFDDIKVIVISGREPHGIAGAAAVLQKPLVVPQFLELLHRLLRHPEANGPPLNHPA